MISGSLKVVLTHFMAQYIPVYINNLHVLEKNI